MEVACRKCGKPNDLWTNHGFQDGDRHFCCRGCATGFFCFCRTYRDPSRLVQTAAYAGPERRLGPQRRAWKQERRAIFLRQPH